MRIEFFLKKVPRGYWGFDLLKVGHVQITQHFKQNFNPKTRNNVSDFVSCVPLCLNNIITHIAQLHIALHTCAGDCVWFVDPVRLFVYTISCIAHYSRAEALCEEIAGAILCDAFGCVSNKSCWPIHFVHGPRGTFKSRFRWLDLLIFVRCYLQENVYVKWCTRKYLLSWIFVRRAISGIVQIFYRAYGCMTVSNHACGGFTLVVLNFLGTSQSF